MTYSRLQLLIIAIIAEGLILVLALVLAAVFRIELQLSLKNVVTGLPVSIAGTIGPLILFILSLTKKAQNIRFINSLRRTVMKDIKKLFEHAGFSDIVLISLLAGVAEELLFRGVIQSSIGIVGAAILFGLAHFITRTYVLMATLMGLYLGLFFEMTGNIFIPIQIHALYDFGALLYLKYFVADSPDGEP